MQINWHKIVSKSEEMNKIAPFLRENSLARMKLSYKVVANRLRLPGRPRYITIYNRNTLRDPAAAVPCQPGSLCKKSIMCSEPAAPEMFPPFWSPENRISRTEILR